MFKVVWKRREKREGKRRVREKEREGERERGREREGREREREAGRERDYLFKLGISLIICKLLFVKAENIGIKEIIYTK